MDAIYSHPDDIRGWLTREEGQCLASLAIDRVVLELGSYAGRSTIAMARTANLVVSVDWHQGDRDTGPADTWAEMLRNLRRERVEGKVVAVRSSIEQAGKILAPGAFTLAFIDSAHDEDSVTRDTRLAMRLVAPGGIVAWHDWNYAAVQRAVAACGLKPTNQTGEVAWTTLAGR